jgi:hypothetical protein
MIKSQPVSIIIVKKNASLQNLSIKDFKEDDLFKKCGFKKADGFKKQTVWNINHNGINYSIVIYGKNVGRANNENKYEFPPPVDTQIFFGCCCIVAVNKTDDKPISLTLKNWELIYEKLFGGFEDLSKKSDGSTDEDEMSQIPKERQTKTGYLKDEFVVDDTSDSDLENDSSSESDLSLEEMSNDVIDNTEELFAIEDIGSELSEESYDTE